MKSFYRVINKETKEDITDKECWVLRPDGSLAVNEYGDLIGRTYAEVIFNGKESKWVPVSQKPGLSLGMKCALCKSRITYGAFFNGNYNYCYHCGALMIKDTEDLKN